MAPDVTFKLDEDAFTRYDALLAAQGITVFPKSRDTHEIFGDPERTITSTHGIVQHQGRDFQFTLRHSRCGSAFALFVVDQDADAILAIMDAVERAFPQPKRPEREKDPRTFITNYGCFFFIAFILLVCILAVVGAYSLFR